MSTRSNDTSDQYSASTARDRAGSKIWIGRVLSGLVIAFLIMDAVMKLMNLPIVVETGAQLGWPADSALTLGVMLSVITILYSVPKTSILGAVLLTGYLGGAIATHLRLADPLFTHTLFGVYVGIFAWAGLWFRDTRVRAFLSPPKK